MKMRLVTLKISEIKIFTLMYTELLQFSANSETTNFYKSNMKGIYFL